jgi:putative FmdB family regulatory protein
MPFYEYQCKSCGHMLEAMQKVNDSPLKKCPDCGKSQLTRLMSAPVFRLKGAGWYETDFKGDQDQKKNLADRPEAEPVKEEKAAEAKAAEIGAKDAAKPADKDAAKPADKAADKKPAEKAVEKAPAAEPRKKAGSGMSKRGATVKPSLKKPVKKSRAAASKRRA